MLKTDYFLLVERLLASVPALERLNVSFLSLSEDEAWNRPRYREPPLLLSSLNIPNLKHLHLSMEEIDNPVLYALLNRHKRTLVSVEITHLYCDSVRGISCSGILSELELPKLENLVAPYCYFQRLGPETGPLTSATIIWNDAKLDSEPVVAALNRSRQSLRSLTCWRTGSNID